MRIGKHWSARLGLGVILLLTACGGLPTPNSNAPTAQPSKIPDLPKSAIELNIIDVAGGQQLAQGMFDDYKAARPNLVSKITITTAPAPELPAKIKAQQQGGNVQFDIVLTGSDGLSAGVEQNLWYQLFPNYQQKFPDLKATLQEPAYRMQQLTKGYGLIYTYTQSGPLIEYNPAKVTSPPTSPQELLDWAKAHPKRVEYARPANSGPGRTLLQGLPYLLGDKDPRDPIKGWDRTWAYLKELNNYIEYYPTGTKVTMTDIANGSRDIIASTMGWDMNPRALGTVPNTVQVGLLQKQGFRWLSDSQYMVVPRGISDDHLAVALDFLNFMLQPKEQAHTYDKGYFYPGPAVKNVPLSLAPPASQQVVGQFVRSDYEQWIKQYPVEIALDTKPLNDAFEKWDREVGSGKTK
jgi:putative spermidine/putrescine transport system substrate-binding protein